MKGANDIINRSDRFAGGADRVQTIDLGSNPATQRGKSGAKKNGNVTSRSVQTGGAGDGVKRQRGRSTTHFEQPTAGTGATRRKFRESAGFFAGDEPTKPTTQILAERKASGAGIKPPSPVKTGGTVRPPVSDKQKATSLSRITDQGEFKKGGKTLSELAAKRGAGVFTEQGINELFGSAADLAKLFSSREFQERKAKGIQSAAGVKGRRADAKAKTDRITALSGVLEDLSATGGDNEALIGRIQEQIQNLISGGGGGATPELVAKLSDKFDDEQIKTILGIIQ